MATIETERGTITIIQKGEKMDNFKEKAKEVGKKAWEVTKKYAPYALAVGCFYIFCDAIYKIGTEDAMKDWAEKTNDSFIDIQVIDNEKGSIIPVFISKEALNKSIATENFQLLLKRFPDSSNVDILNF